MYVTLILHSLFERKPNMSYLILCLYNNIIRSDTQYGITTEYFRMHDYVPSHMILENNTYVSYLE